jgi:hypothetical protein
MCSLFIKQFYTKTVLWIFKMYSAILLKQLKVFNRDQFPTVIVHVTENHVPSDSSFQMLNYSDQFFLSFGEIEICASLIETRLIIMISCSKG